MPSQTSGLGVQPCRLQSSLQPGPGGSHASPLSTTPSPQRGRVHVVRHASGVVSLFRSPSSQASFPSTVPLPHTAITRPGGNVNSVLWSLWPTVKRSVCEPRSSPIPKRMVIGFAVPVRSTCWAMTSKVHFTSPAPLVARTISTSLTPPGFPLSDHVTRSEASVPPPWVDLCSKLPGGKVAANEPTLTVTGSWAGSTPSLAAPSLNWPLTSNLPFSGFRASTSTDALTTPKPASEAARAIGPHGDPASASRSPPPATAAPRRRLPGVAPR